MSRRDRELQAGTKLKLEEIARWQALGQSVEQIARLMNMTPNAVSRLISHESYPVVQEKVIAKVYGHVDGAIAERKADVMLKEAAPDAATTLIALLNEGLPGDRRQAATAVLDRAGYAPIQKRAVHQKIEFDPMTMGLLRVALLESAQEEGIDDGDESGDGEGADEGQLQGTV